MAPVRARLQSRSGEWNLDVGEASPFGAAKPTVNTILTLEPRSGGRITAVGATHGSPPEGRDGVAAVSRRRVIRAKRDTIVLPVQMKKMAWTILHKNMVLKV